MVEPPAPGRTGQVFALYPLARRCQPREGGPGERSARLEGGYDRLEFDRDEVVGVLQQVACAAESARVAELAEAVLDRNVGVRRALLRRFESDHAGIEIFGFRVEARRRQQLLRHTVIEVNVTLSFAFDALGNEREVSPI